MPSVTNNQMTEKSAYHPIVYSYNNLLKLLVVSTNKLFDIYKTKTREKIEITVSQGIFPILLVSMKAGKLKGKDNKME